MSYDQHVPMIAAGCRGNPEVFRRAALFVLLSIRQQTPGLPRMMQDVALRHEYSPYLYGMKRNGYLWLNANFEELHAQILKVNDPAAAIFMLSSMPGLGIIKAAFLAQLLGFDVACLDSRNMIRQGRSTDEYKPHGRRDRKFDMNVRRYVAETRGRAREYWDTWCDEVDKAYRLTPGTISLLHLDCIMPECYRASLVDCPPCPRIP